MTSVRVSFLVMALGAAAATVYAWCSALRTVDASELARLKDAANHLD